jgi:hypothetical protein
MSTIKVVDNEAKSTFHRSIPAGYIVHLHWMTFEGSLPNRGSWPRQLLDHFADEIKAAGDMSSWRSTALTPALGRALFDLDDFDAEAIVKRARAEIPYRNVKVLTAMHWATFYFHHDVLDPSTYRDWWVESKHFKGTPNLVNSAEEPAANPAEGKPSTQKEHTTPTLFPDDTEGEPPEAEITSPPPRRTESPLAKVVEPLQQDPATPPQHHEGLQEEPMVCDG